MLLTVIERLLTISGVKQEGDIVFLRIRFDLIKKLALTEEEIKKYEMRIDPDGMSRWKLDVPQEVEINISDTEKSLITDFLSTMNRERKLSSKHISLYEKFVEKT